MLKFRLRRGYVTTGHAVVLYRTSLKCLAMGSAAAALISCAGYVPGVKSVWDNRIQDLCTREGRLEILERVVLTKKQADQMPRIEGKISTRPKNYGDPVYSERIVTSLRASNPRVTREEVTIIRRVDQRPVARWVEYARVGGDVPTGLAHDSYFRCPDPRERLEDLQNLFVVQSN